jgi:hypothetical protein
MRSERSSHIHAPGPGIGACLTERRQELQIGNVPKLAGDCICKKIGERKSHGSNEICDSFAGRRRVTGGFWHGPCFISSSFT